MFFFILKTIDYQLFKKYADKMLEKKKIKICFISAF